MTTTIPSGVLKGTIPRVDCSGLILQNTPGVDDYHYYFAVW